MEANVDQSGKCRVCGEFIDNSEHNNTVNHRFHFSTWQYNIYRKPLAQDRHGIVLEVQEDRTNNFHYLFAHNKKRGKYVTQVTPEQLQLHNNTISYSCKLKNISKNPIYILNVNLLHESTCFQLQQRHVFGPEIDTFLLLLPGKQYTFEVIFTSEVLTCASYKIPLSCDFQTKDTNQAFSIIRTFLTTIDDQNPNDIRKQKSPFTSQPWKDIKTIKRSTKEDQYIDVYPIPPNYARLLKYGLRDFDKMSYADSQNLRELRTTVAQLTETKYSKFWHIILWMEETAQALMLTKYNMEEVTMQIKDKDILVLEVPGLAEKRPSVVTGDHILIRLHNDHTGYKGLITQVNDQTVEISNVDDELVDTIRDDPTQELDVAFKLSRLSFERMHYAVDRVTATGILSVLFPKNCHESASHALYNLEDSDFYNPSIIHNEEQRNAVMKILNSTQKLPYIVFGPPGTGKTVTIVEAILQVKKLTKKRILVCAPSNSACDVLALKLIEHEHCSKKELIRIHSTTREKTSLSAKLLEYSNWDKENEEFTRIEYGDLASYRIVVTTLTLIGRFKRDYHPDCVFVDEAAQASEPETDIAVAFLSVGKQVVLAGDPKQLGPMVTDCASKLGLGISLLERLMDYPVYKPNANTRTYDTNFITMLKLNFRSHPDILLIPNQLFYDNNLEARSVDARLDPLVKISIYDKIQRRNVRTNPKKKSEQKISKALEFCSLSSKEKREGSSPSFFNIFESKMVVNYVRTLINLDLGPKYKVTQDQIGVVTPYKRQVHKIQEGLRFSGFGDVEVGTTESFQGREKRIIIISTVRAQHCYLLHDRKYNLGFVKNDQRFNVAITRAISKLIIVGCPLVLRKDRKWDMYMQLCKDFNTYFGHDFRETNDDVFQQEVITRFAHVQFQDDQHQHNNQR